MIGLWLLAGGLTGVVNGFTQWWTVARLRADMQGHPHVLTVGGMLLRLALAAALLSAGFRHGAVSGVLAFAGLWLVRSAIVIWVQTAGIPRLPASTRRHPARVLRPPDGRRE